MFIKQRQVRRSSKFQSRWSRGSYKRREYMATVYATALVQLFLAFFLIIGVFRTGSVMQAKFPDVQWYLRYALPTLLLLVAVFISRALAKNIRQIAATFGRRPPDRRQ